MGLSLGALALSKDIRARRSFLSQLGIPDGRGETESGEHLPVLVGVTERVLPCLTFLVCSHLALGERLLMHQGHDQAGEAQIGALDTES